MMSVQNKLVVDALSTNVLYGLHLENAIVYLKYRESESQNKTTET